MENNLNIELKKKFDEVAEKLRSYTKLDNKQKLRFYGLYKVVTVGPYTDANKMPSGFFDFTTKYKNEAWEKCSIYTKEEAMIEYIKYYSEITGTKIDIDIYINKENKETKKSINEIGLDIPEGLESQGMYSSNKGSQEEVKKYLETASENEKKFQSLKEKIYDGDLITEDIIKEFENKNNLNLLEFKDNILQTILHISVDAMNFSAIDSLIKLNYAQNLINLCDNEGMTPMHIASINFDVHIYDLLTQINPDYSIKDKDNKTCKDYLKENTDVEIPKKYLRDE